MDGQDWTVRSGTRGSCLGLEKPKEGAAVTEKKDERKVERLSEVVKYMKTLRAAQHIDLALSSITLLLPVQIMSRLSQGQISIRK